MKTSKTERLAISLIFLIFALVFVAIRSAHDPHGNPADRHAGASSQQHEEPESIWLPTTWTAPTTAAVLLVFVTAGLWFYTAKLWSTTSQAVRDGEKAIAAAVKAADASNLHVAEAARAASAMEDGNKINRERFIGEQRPWMGIDALPLGLNYDADNIYIDVKFILYNYGQSPAIDVAEISGINFMMKWPHLTTEQQIDNFQQDGIRRAFHAQEVERKKIAIFPGQKQEIIANFSDKKTTVPFFDQNNCMKAVIVVAVTYKSIFSEDNYHTCMCFELGEYYERFEGQTLIKGWKSIHPSRGALKHNELQFIHAASVRAT